MRLCVNKSNDGETMVGDTKQQSLGAAVTTMQMK
jgi:hypothetical protein